MKMNNLDRAAVVETATDAAIRSSVDGASPERHLDRATLEVVPKAKRRRFTAEYKRRILREADALRAKGESVGELLRREGLYSSHLGEWRRAAEQGAISGLGKKRGRKRTRDAGRYENDKLKKRVARLEEKLRKAEIIIDVQKKVASLLGIPLATVPETEESHRTDDTEEET